MSTVSESCDVVVVGGGPAGSLAATYLAGKGYSVALFEKEKHPRYQVGESLGARAKEAMGFRSTQAQTLMYAASLLTDRSRNFESMADSPEPHRAATERVRPLEIPRE